MTTLLNRLARTNRTAVFLTVAVLVFVALLVPGWAGGLLLLLLVGASALVSRATWRIHPGGVRAARVLILAALALVAILKIA